MSFWKRFKKMQDGIDTRPSGIIAQPPEAISPLVSKVAAIIAAGDFNAAAPNEYGRTEFKIAGSECLNARVSAYVHEGPPCTCLYVSGHEVQINTSERIALFVSIMDGLKIQREREQAPAIAKIMAYEVKKGGAQ